MLVAGVNREQATESKKPHGGDGQAHDGSAGEGDLKRAGGAGFVGGDAGADVCESGSFHADISGRG